MSDDAADLTLRELGSRLCRCGVRKAKGATFCVSCYARLPPELQRDLYRRLDQAFLDAYGAAVAYLTK